MRGLASRLDALEVHAGDMRLAHLSDDALEAALERALNQLADMRKPVPAGLTLDKQIVWLDQALQSGTEETLQ
jgi:hypothetical protein